MNDKVLEYDCFLIGVNGILEKLLTKSNTSIASWEVFKSEIKRFVIERWWVLRQQERKKEGELKRELEFFAKYRLL